MPVDDIKPGSVFGMLAVIKRSDDYITPGSGRSRIQYLCQCECGNQSVVRKTSLTSGQTRSCGCLRDRSLDLLGKRFGALTVIKRIRGNFSLSDKAHWLCKCDCGNTIVTFSSNLTSGNTKSCGHCTDIKPGDRFHNLNVLLTGIKKRVRGLSAVRSHSYCLCGCGNYATVLDTSLKNGNIKSCGCLQNASGSRSSNWRGGVTPEHLLQRSSLEYSMWRSDVFERDMYICRFCGYNQGGNLHAHHINGFSCYPEMRLVTNNGITLCQDCHRQYHSIYGINANQHDFLSWFMQLDTLTKEEP